MMEELEKPEYQNMRLVDIVYGEDDYKADQELTVREGAVFRTEEAWSI